MNRYIAVPTTLKRLLVAMGLVLGSSFAATTAHAAAPANTLQSIEVQPVAGQGLQLALTLSGRRTETMAFTIDTPRQSFDLPDTALALTHVASMGAAVGSKQYSRGGHAVAGCEPRRCSYQTRGGASNSRDAGEAARRNALRPAAAARHQPAALPDAAAPGIDFRRGNDGPPRSSSCTIPASPSTAPEGNRSLGFRRCHCPDISASHDVALRPGSSFDAMPMAMHAHRIDAIGESNRAYRPRTYVIEIQRAAGACAVEARPSKRERMSANSDIDTQGVLQLLQTPAARTSSCRTPHGHVTMRRANVPGSGAGRGSGLKVSTARAGHVSSSLLRGSDAKGRRAFPKDIQDLGTAANTCR